MYKKIVFMPENKIEIYDRCRDRKLDTPTKKLTFTSFLAKLRNGTGVFC